MRQTHFITENVALSNEQEKRKMKSSVSTFHRKRNYGGNKIPQRKCRKHPLLRVRMYGAVSMKMKMVYRGEWPFFCSILQFSVVFVFQCDSIFCNFNESRFKTHEVKTIFYCLTQESETHSISEIFFFFFCGKIIETENHRKWKLQFPLSIENETAMKIKLSKENVQTHLNKKSTFIPRIFHIKWKWFCPWKHKIVIFHFPCITKLL